MKTTAVATGRFDKMMRFLSEQISECTDCPAFKVCTARYRCQAAAPWVPGDNCNRFLRSWVKGDRGL